MELKTLVKAFKHGLTCEKTGINISAEGYLTVIAHAKMAGIYRQNGDCKSAMVLAKNAIFFMKVYNRVNKIKG